jgi:parallel beta-helix repeat protein
MLRRLVLATSLLLCAVAAGAGCGSAKMGSSATTASPSFPSSSTLTIVTTSMPSGIMDSAYSASLTAKGGTPPYTWSLNSGSLPSGLQLNSATGVISGSPNATGERSIQFGVADSDKHSAHTTLTISIASKSSSPTPSSQLSIQSPSLPNATVGSSYSFTLTAQGGTAPYSWTTSSGALPQGLQLNTSKGLIQGTPTQAGNASVTMEVKDSTGDTATHSFSLSVAAQAASSNSYRSFYVDSAAGNDDNEGTSESAPWKTVAKVNSSDFLPGDHILFKRGDTWRELLSISSSGSSGNPIVIDAYGSGAAPIITGADLVAAGFWTLCSSCGKSVWQASVSAQPNLVMFNGTSGAAVNSLSALASAGQWYWNSNLLYVWSASNPGSAYNSPGIESGDRKIIVDLSGLSFITLQTLQLMGGNGIPTNAVVYAHEVNGTPPQDLVLNNLVIANGVGHGVRLEDCNNCEIQGLTVSGVGSDGISFASLDASNPITSGSITGNTVTTSVHDGIATYGCAIGGTCLGEETPNGVFISGLTISGNTVHDNGEGIYLQWTNHSTVSANTSYHNTVTTNPASEGGGIELEASSNNVVEKNVIYQNRGNGVELSNDAGAGSTLTGASNNVLQYNVVHDNGNHGLFTNDAPTQSNQFLYNLIWNQVNGECFIANGIGHVFAGNVCWNNSTGIDLYTSSSTTVTSNITVKNNIIANSIVRAVHIESGVTSSTLAFDYNDYDFGSGAEFMLFDTAYSLSGWQPATGFDNHSLVANPQFVSASPSAPGDFVIQASSPAVGAGVNLGSALAVGLNPGSAWPSNVSSTNQSSAWDIGPFIVH